MKRLITIILALIMTLFTAPQKSADVPLVTAVETPQTAITVQVEQVARRNRNHLRNDVCERSKRSGNRR